jgi:L-amino acid N-acyltransferase YncA
MPQRYEYLYPLTSMSSQAAPDLAGVMRQPTAEDREGLAVLMLDAYLNTIDYEGETLAEARNEIQGYFGGAPLLGCSWVYVENQQLVSACLVADWPQRGCAIIAYVITRPTHKGRGVGRMLVQQSMHSLQSAGYAEVRAVITEGNGPSEQLFKRLGFMRVG